MPNYLDVKEVQWWISNLGFPIAITIYLLVRLDKILSQLLEQTTRQTELLRRLAKNGEELK